MVGDAEDPDPHDSLADLDQRLRAHQQWLADFEQGRAERERHYDELVTAAGAAIARQRERNENLRRALRRRAGRLTVAGALAGGALIWGASRTTGFWSLLLDALGTGLLVAATVSVAAAVVAGYWKAATEVSSEAILDELRRLHSLLIRVSSAVESAAPLREPLRSFLLEHEADKRVAATVMRSEGARLEQQIAAIFADLQARRAQSADPGSSATTPGSPGSP